MNHAGNTLAVNWELAWQTQKQGRPQKTRRATFKENMQAMGVI